ncbi:Type I phosphodiesterase/nucleotide pyrophosphatase [Planctomycetales bacterium 10988]|nr:Type I phosphodiesterase/nucleotide pyrophosphatase [Planctomycetales bacterium 10988]
MAKPLVVINVVGLCMDQIGPDTPHLRAFAEEGFACPMGTVLPAVTCSAQATMLTGKLPREHGIVGNGWYFRDLSEVLFWRQSHPLIQAECLYETLKKEQPDHSTAKLFWWYNMYAPVDFSLTPRPSYPADGRKLPDIYSDPAELRDEIQQKLGDFPLFKFWGPTANIESTRWIADASIELMKQESPDLTLIYLPHLDYNLQRIGPNDTAVAEDLKAVDAEVGKLLEAARTREAEVVILSEYAIQPVDKPIHLNRILREAGYLRVRRETLGWETLDCGASRAFAVADHQVAHVYVKHPGDLAEVKKRILQVDGVEHVLDREEQAAWGIDHPRSGELVVIAAPGAWFTYYFWLDEKVAPDYAPTVDIHRKPGYDPVELFVNPDLKVPMARVIWRLLQKKLGFRYYMDVIGTDASLVKGSHGRLPQVGKEATEGPVFMASNKKFQRDFMKMEEVRECLLAMQMN